MTVTVNPDIEFINQKLKDKILQYIPEQNKLYTTIPEFTLCRVDKACNSEMCFYEPMISIVIQGNKHSVIGNKKYQYGQYNYIVAGIDIPSVSHIPIVSVDQPFLSMSIKLNRYLITQLVAELPKQNLSAEKLSPIPAAGIILGNVNSELLNAFLRLTELLEHPERIPVLAPMIIREIHFLLLSSPQGASLRMLCALGTHSSRIASAISWLRENYRQSFNIEQLAEFANMAPSSFYRHFRRITTLSPLQFQKQLRLCEAERLMMVSGYNASRAAFSVGYESITQFNREYKRQFGKPPFRDVNQKKLTGFSANDVISAAL